MVRNDYYCGVCPQRFESELIQAMLETRINDGDYSADAERNKALANYFKARDEIRERAGRERA